MRTNIEIDDGLMAELMEYSGLKTKKAVVTEALRQYIARREQLRILDLFGKLEWSEDYDYKAERRRP